MGFFPISLLGGWLGTYSTPEHRPTRRPRTGVADLPDHPLVRPSSPENLATSGMIQDIKSLINGVDSLNKSNTMEALQKIDRD